MDPCSSHRTETRTRLEVPITLVSLDLATYEVTSTQDVSLHGACVLTKQQWTPNTRIDVRSLRVVSTALPVWFIVSREEGRLLLWGWSSFSRTATGTRIADTLPLRVGKDSLDINSLCGGVEKCVSVQTGTFCV